MTPTLHHVSSVLFSGKSVSTDRIANPDALHTTFILLQTEQICCSVRASPGQRLVSDSCKACSQGDEDTVLGHGGDGRPARRAHDCVVHLQAPRLEAAAPAALPAAGGLLRHVHARAPGDMRRTCVLHSTCCVLHNTLWLLPLRIVTLASLSASCPHGHCTCTRRWELDMPMDHILAIGHIVCPTLTICSPMPRRVCGFTGARPHSHRRDHVRDTRHLARGSGPVPGVDIRPPDGEQQSALPEDSGPWIQGGAELRSLPCMSSGTPIPLIHIADQVVRRLCSVRPERRFNKTRATSKPRSCPHEQCSVAERRICVVRHAVCAYCTMCASRCLPRHLRRNLGGAGCASGWVGCSSAASCDPWRGRRRRKAWTGRRSTARGRRISSIATAPCLRTTKVRFCV